MRRSDMLPALYLHNPIPDLPRSRTCMYFSHSCASSFRPVSPKSKSLFEKSISKSQREKTADVVIRLHNLLHRNTRALSKENTELKNDAKIVRESVEHTIEL